MSNHQVLLGGEHVGLIFDVAAEIAQHFHGALVEKAPTILGYNRKMIREPRRWRRLTENGWLMLIPEPARQSSEVAELDLVTLDPGVQSTVCHRDRRIAAIERVCLRHAHQ
jgi:hypothetical protein